jgi:hypothetical protein
MSDEASTSNANTSTVAAISLVSALCVELSRSKAIDTERLMRTCRELLEPLKDPTQHNEAVLTRILEMIEVSLNLGARDEK